MGRVSLKTSVNENQLKRDRPRDISGWKFISHEPKGTRVKSILRRDNTTFLFKEPNDPLEIDIEVFNSILANELDISHVQYFPALYKGKPGVVCERFLRSSPQVDELMEMKELLYRHSAKLQRFSAAEFKELMGRDEDAVAEQSIDNIFLVLEEESDGHETVLKPFFRMIGFDALIGHTDRHWENYGILLAHNRRRSLVLKLAPLYDTVTSYLVGSTSDERLEKMLRKEFLDPTWYQPNREDNCKIKVPNKPRTNHFDLLRYIAKSSDMSVYLPDVFWSFERFDRKLVVAIMKRFFSHLSDVRKRTIIEILCQRHRIGMQIRDGV